MIRAALALMLLATPAAAATDGQCAAVLERLGARAEAVALTGDACVFADVRYGDGAGRWRADRVIVSGDVDALPDALPSRLTGGVTGLRPDPALEGQPGLAWLLAEQARPGLGLTFDIAAQGGTLRINALTLRAGGTGEATLTARLSGLPEVWPVDPVPVATMRLVELDATVAFDGLFETWLLMPMGLRLIDVAQPAEPQVAALRAQASARLDAFDGTPLEVSAAETRAFLDDLPHPRGELHLRVGGAGLTLRQGMTLADGSVAGLSRETALDLTWEPDAP